MLRPTQMTVGADPETFLQQAGRIIGSERVIPREGLKRTDLVPALIVQDGIQVEFNPLGSRDVPSLARQFTNAFLLLRRHLLQYPQVSLCWEELVEVGRDELDSLSPESRELGCQPSENVYGAKPITVDRINYRKRSAGGHLHFGLRMLPTLYSERRNAVPLLDIFVGNTCVLLDKDPGQIERRVNYGRAGEFRYQPHGLEYRTPSNFWLRAYPLMSLVFGLADIALSVLHHRIVDADIEQELIDTVDIQQVIRAIDGNDWNLAKSNFEKIKPFLIKHLPPTGFVLRPANIERFSVFVERVKETSLKAYFPASPEIYWANPDLIEFNTFLDKAN